MVRAYHTYDIANSADNAVRAEHYGDRSDGGVPNIARLCFFYGGKHEEPRMHNAA